MATTSTNGPSSLHCRPGKIEKQIFQIKTKCLKIPTGGGQTSRRFTQRSRGVEHGATQNTSSECHGGGLEPGTTKVQVWRHLATPPPQILVKFV